MFSLNNLFLFCRAFPAQIVGLFSSLRVSSLNQGTNDLRLNLGKMDNNGVIRGASSISSVQNGLFRLCWKTRKLTEDSNLAGLSDPTFIFVLI